MLERWKIPGSWNWVSIRDVGEVTTGNTPSTSDISNYGEEVIFVKPPDLIDKGVWTAPNGLSEKGTKAARILPVGAVLVSCIGVLGKTGITRVPAAFNQQINAVVFKKGIQPEYGFYYAQTLKEWLHNVASATTLPIVNKSKFEQAPFPLASTSEQRSIVAEIEKQFSRLDEAVANLNRVKTNLKRYKASVLKAAVEGKLTEQWRKEHLDLEPTDKLLKRILAERRQKWEEAELAKMRERGIEPKDSDWKRRYKGPNSSDLEDLPVLPIGWVWATLDQMAAAEPNAITDGPFGSNLKTEHYTEHGPRVIRLQNIGYAEFIDEKAHIAEEHYERLIKHSARPDDIVIAALGQPTPRACLVLPRIGKAIVKADCIRFRISPHLNSGYLMYALNSEPTQKRTENIVHGIGRPRLNLGEIKSIPLPVPPKNEQEAIFEEIEHRLSVGLDLLRKVESDINRAGRLRQSILKKAFSGRLIPQDSNDEPAKELLARIRIERHTHEIELKRHTKREKQPKQTPGEPWDGNK